MSEVRGNLAKDKAKSHFSMKRSLIVSKRVLRQITRDKRTFGMLIVMPIIIMAIFGIALNGDVKNLPILIDNEDAGFNKTIPTPPAGSVNLNITAGANLTIALQADDRLQITLGNYDTNKDGVDNGTYYAVILIPVNFSENLANKLLNPLSTNNPNATITIYLDGTKSVIKATILAALQDDLKNAMGNSSAGVTIDDQYAFGGVDFSGLSQAIPAVMGFVLTMLVLIVSMLTLKRETVEGTEERLLTTPLKVSERMVGYVLALVLLALIMVFAILIFGVYVFGAAVEGSLWILILMLLLYALTNVFLAIFLSNFARNEFQGIQMAVLIALPSLALGGILIPVISFPGYVQVIAHFIPLYYAVRIFEGVMLKGWDFTILWPDVLILCAFAIGFFILSLVTVKDKLDA